MKESGQGKRVEHTIIRGFMIEAQRLNFPFDTNDRPRVTRISLKNVLKVNTTSDRGYDVRRKFSNHELIGQRRPYIQTDRAYELGLQELMSDNSPWTMRGERTSEKIFVSSQKSPFHRLIVTLLAICFFCKKTLMDIFSGKFCDGTACE